MQTNQTPINLIFGPVASRRFGISLGIDLSPNIKQCNFDCLYCELAASKTISKQNSSPKVSDIIDQVKDAIQKHQQIEVITLTANGEPTLYPYLDQLIDELNKIKQNKKLLILSNGSTIYKNNIFRSLQQIDIVKLSLDCATQKCFKKLDRANNSVELHKIIDGIITFSKVYNGDLILEVLFVDGINTKDDEIDKLYQILKQIKPNRVDIGTIDRPPAYDVKPIGFDKLQEIANKFTDINVNITFKNRPKSLQSFNHQEIIKLLKMRPLTQDDIDNTFDTSSVEILKKLIQDKIISVVESSGVLFYKIFEI
jgi:wyosine [tRNA(Phe)-imidazoG37] synthetase (radical SAM superfamily)